MTTDERLIELLRAENIQLKKTVDRLQNAVVFWRKGYEDASKIVEYVHKNKLLDRKAGKEIKNGH